MRTTLKVGVLLWFVSCSGSVSPQAQIPATVQSPESGLIVVASPNEDGTIQVQGQAGSVEAAVAEEVVVAPESVLASVSEMVLLYRAYCQIQGFQEKYTHQVQRWHCLREVKVSVSGLSSQRPSI